MAPFGRLITAMITPFNDDGEVDYERVWRLARYLVDHGSDGLVVTGTTGESPTLTSEEKVSLYRTVVEAVGQKGAVVAGTGTYDTRESIELSKRAAEAECDGVLAVTPYYSRPPQQGLIAHFTAIADATDLPLMLYNIPGRTGRLIEVGTLARLAEHPRIVAVKDAVDDVAFTVASRAALPDDFAIYSGSDKFTLPQMSVGAVGVVSVASHLAGLQIKRMVEAAASGDFTEAQRLHFGLLPLFEACFVEPNPMPVKAALGALWEPVGLPRLPLVEASAETVQLVKQAVGEAQRL
jgi:4-hydroxy-tetrahydrodipicolinate synthase